MNFDYTKFLDFGGVGACLAYFIYRDITFMKGLTKAFDNLAIIVAELKGKVGA